MAAPWFWTTKDQGSKRPGGAFGKLGSTPRSKVLVDPARLAKAKISDAESAAISWALAPVPVPAPTCTEQLFRAVKREQNKQLAAFLANKRRTEAARAPAAKQALAGTRSYARRLAKRRAEIQQRNSTRFSNSFLAGDKQFREDGISLENRKVWKAFLPRPA